jgi:alginate O-acetyltransferase complex protein AlgI
MLFSEPAFLFFFLPLLFVVYFIVPKVLRNLVLLGFSLGFYAYGEKLFVLLMLFSIMFNYVIGIGIDKAQSQKGRKFWLAAGITGDLGLLIAFKYANFLVDNLNIAFSAVGISPIELGPVHLPIGISFFTFQSMSYLIDLYRGQVKTQRNPLDLALYISLFPQLIAGPIVRYSDIAAQLAKRNITIASFAYGVERFLLGLGKKMIIANAAAYPADQIFSLPHGEVSMGLAWFGVFCYAIQIYFDFSGYSDMAIGLGRMFGFKFRENFNYPYIATSVTEFWRRWHISLSTWFRDYLYIPLGGNRVAKWRAYFNLWIVFFLCGFWHGSSWNFILWGIYFGVFLVVERVFLKKLLDGAPRVVGHLYIAFVILISWTMFRAVTLDDTLNMYGAMFGLSGDTRGMRPIAHFIDAELIVLLIVGLIGSVGFVPWWQKRYKAFIRDQAPAQQGMWETLGFAFKWLCLSLILFYSMMLMAAGSYNPFIYFRF